MEDLFEIYGFRFIDKKTRMRAVVYARSEEKAMKIIEMWNSFQDIYCWVKPRFGFKKKYVTSKEPYVLEQEQIRTIEGWKEHTLKNKDKEQYS